ncbi:MAG TPA: DUF6249 domain-containing protein [Anaerolineae bacterium]|jgi:hypothetical protein
MNDFLEWFVPCFTVLSIFLIIFGFAAFMRYMKYRETVALAEKGLLRQKMTNANGRDSLRWGIIITSLGLAAGLGLCPVGLFTGESEFFVAATFLGLLPTFFGLGLIVIHWVTERKKGAEE